MASFIVDIHREMNEIQMCRPNVSMDVLYDTHQMFGTHMIIRALMDTNREVVARKSINNLVLDLQHLEWSQEEIQTLLNQLYTIYENEKPKPNLKKMNQIDDVLDALEENVFICRDDSENELEDCVEETPDDDDWDNDDDDGYKTPEKQIRRFTTEEDIVPPPLPLRRENTSDYDVSLMRQYPFISSIDHSNCWAYNPDEDDELIEGWGGNSQNNTPTAQTQPLEVPALSITDYEEICDWYKTLEALSPTSESWYTE